MLDGDWQAIVQPPARLEIERRANTLQLDYDFQGSGGFVVARLPIQVRLSERFHFSFDYSGSGPENQLEFKLADDAGNCWRYLDAAFRPDSAPRPLEINQDSFAFAWGPAGFGAPRHISAIEIALVATSGGRGALRIDNLSLHDLGPAPLPRLRTSSQSPDWRPEDWWAGRAPWCPLQTDPSPWIELAFAEAQSIMGLCIQWQGRGADTSLSLPLAEDTEASNQDGDRLLAQGLCPAHDLSYFWLGQARVSRLRIRLAQPAAIARIQWLPGSASTDAEDPHSQRQALAQYLYWQVGQRPRGWQPRHLLREQSYWTCLGTPDGQGSPLINEDGQIELDGADACLDALLLVHDQSGDQLLGWADADRQPSLDAEGLPLPEVRLDYRAVGLRLDVRALALHQHLAADYLLGNRGAAPSSGTLFIALRPFQLTPAWQAGHRHFGGLGRIFDLDWDGTRLLINNQRQLLPRPAPDRCGATSSQRNEVIADLALNQIPPATNCQDHLGWASAALAYRFDLAPGEQLAISCLIPYANWSAQNPLLELAQLGRDGRVLAARLAWRTKLAGLPRLSLGVDAGVKAGVKAKPTSQPNQRPAHTMAQAAAQAATSAIAHSLIQRQGSALQPGARRYTRAWIRDGVVQCAALLRAGCTAEAARYLEWYASHQASDGRIPCCIDTSEPKGPDWLVEHDSLGQFLFGVMEVWRFSGDGLWLARLWPQVRLALKAMERLLEQPALTPPLNSLGAGLLPPSASHEGYLAHPVQAYWDDFWALRGLQDALAMAEVLRKGRAATAIRRLLGRFETDLGRSLQGLIEQQQLDFVPGSVELADFDPAATATALAWLERLPGVSAATLNSGFDRYLQGFRQRRDQQTPWLQYSAYEIRIIPALVRLGRRDEAQELLAYFLTDRRPPAWNQWPEISWRDPRAPGHLGDLPHAWIGAEFFLAWQALFVYEQAESQSLVIAAGIPDAWLDEGDSLQMSGLRTYWGQLDLGLQRRDGALHLELHGSYRLPPGGIQLRPPLKPGEQLLVNGSAVDQPHLRAKPS